MSAVNIVLAITAILLTVAIFAVAGIAWFHAAPPLNNKSGTTVNCNAALEALTLCLSKPGASNYDCMVKNIDGIACQGIFACNKSNNVDQCLHTLINACPHLGSATKTTPAATCNRLKEVVENLTGHKHDLDKSGSALDCDTILAPYPGGSVCSPNYYVCQMTPWAQKWHATGKSNGDIHQLLVQNCNEFIQEGPHPPGCSVVTITSSDCQLLADRVIAQI